MTRLGTRDDRPYVRRRARNTMQGARPAGWRIGVGAAVFAERVDEELIMRGRVKWFSSERGYGFITDVQNRDHRFTVHDVIGGALPTGGETTEFDPGSGDRGAFARRVRIVASAPVGWGTARSHDDRVVCRHCGRRMVPRVITYRGAVERTLCPFCANTCQDLIPTMSLSARTVGWILLMAVGLSGLLVFLS